MTQGYSWRLFREIYVCSQIVALRPLENASDWAADQQAELLGEKHPRDLTERRVCLTLQVQNCRSEKGNAESKAEEDAPVGQCVMGIPFEQSQDPLVDKHFGSELDGTGVKDVEDVKATVLRCKAWQQLPVAVCQVHSCFLKSLRSSSLDCLTHKWVPELIGEVMIRPTIIRPFQECQWLVVKKKTLLKCHLRDVYLWVSPLQKPITGKGINDASTPTVQVVSYLDKRVAKMSKIETFQDVLL